MHVAGRHGSPPSPAAAKPRRAGRVNLVRAAAYCAFVAGAKAVPAPANGAPKKSRRLYLSGIFPSYLLEERRVRHGTKLPAGKSACRRVLRPREKCTGSA